MKNAIDIIGGMCVGVVLGLALLALVFGAVPWLWQAVTR